MRILVATHHTNGDVPGDYDHCIDGELVYMQDPCASDRRDPDGPCGCGRGFAGTNSHRATSTALGVDSEVTPADVDEAIRSSLETGGWLDPAHCTPQAARPPGGPGGGHQTKKAPHKKKRPRVRTPKKT